MSAPLCGSLSLSHVWRSSKVAPHSISLFATHCPCSLCSLHPAAHLLHLLLLLLLCSNKHVQVVAIQPLEWISCYHLFHNFGGSFFVFSPFQLPVNLSPKGFRIKRHTFDQNENSSHHHSHHHHHHNQPVRGVVGIIINIIVVITIIIIIISRSMRLWAARRWPQVGTSGNSRLLMIHQNNANLTFKSHSIGIIIIKSSLLFLTSLKYQVYLG